MSSEWYREKFLKSEEWQALRLKVLERDDGHCFICDKQNPFNDVHHI